jgi:hypothetical protein
MAHRLPLANPNDRVDSERRKDLAAPGRCRLLIDLWCCHAPTATLMPRRDRIEGVRDVPFACPSTPSAAPRSWTAIRSSHGAKPQKWYHRPLPSQPNLLARDDSSPDFYFATSPRASGGEVRHLVRTTNLSRVPVRLILV